MKALRRFWCRVRGHAWRHVAYGPFKGNGFFMCWTCGKCL
jgi:hypothetical protein